MLMKPISAMTHGALDYTLGLFLLLSPWLFSFNHISTAATLTMVVVGLAVLLLSSMTDYPLGALKLVPFTTHRLVETVGAFFLLISPWIVRFSGLIAARNIAILVAIAWFGVIALTNYGAYQSQRPVH